MTIYVRELNKAAAKQELVNVPVLLYELNNTGSICECDLIVRHVIAIEETNERKTRVSFGKNKTHPYIIEFIPCEYYQIEII